MAAKTARSSQLNDTRDPAEIARFDAMAHSWWDAKGPMAVLHRFNPVRVAYIRDQVCSHFARDPLSFQPLSALRIVDVGCGGGVLSEPLARLGADITGIDPAPTNITIAAAHAKLMELEQSGCHISYRMATIEALVAERERFDVVLAMEVIEHVADVPAFIAACAAAVKPGGLVIMATLNRTLKAFALAIIGAEYVLGWLPRGTHQWERFITPDELETLLTDQGLHILGEAGVVYSPLRDIWSLSGDIDVNYMMTAAKSDVAAHVIPPLPLASTLPAARQKRRPEA